MTFPDGIVVRPSERMAEDVRLASPATTPGCVDEEKCLTEPLANASSYHGYRQKWGVSPKWQLVPKWTIVLSIVQIFIFILADQTTIRALRFEPTLRWQVWRFFTYSLVHYGALHLSLNIFVQCFLSWPLEVEQGGLRTISVYGGGGLFGAIGACVIQPQPMLGASAGIYAVLISHCAHIFLNFNSLKYKIYRIFCVFILAGSDIVFCIFHARSDGYPAISLSAHASGGFAGLLLGLLLYKSDAFGEKQFQIRIVRLITIVSTVLLFVSGIILVTLLPAEFFRR